MDKLDEPPTGAKHKIPEYLRSPCLIFEKARKTGKKHKKDDASSSLETEVFFSDNPVKIRLPEKAEASDQQNDRYNPVNGLSGVPYRISLPRADEDKFYHRDNDVVTNLVIGLEGIVVDRDRRRFVFSTFMKAKGFEKKFFYISGNVGIHIIDNENVEKSDPRDLNGYYNGDGGKEGESVQINASKLYTQLMHSPGRN